MRVLLFVPCFIDQLLPNVATSAVKVLEHLGCEVLFPEEQTCCGQPAFNSGYVDDARIMAMHEVNAFANFGRKLLEGERKSPDSEKLYTVGLSGSCVAMMRNIYPTLFKAEEHFHDKAESFSSNVYEFTEFITRHIGADKFSGKLDALVSFHDSCHALRELGIGDAPRKLLSRIDGLRLAELPFRDVCCGFGGTFAVKFPDISAAMADEKLRNLGSTNADILVSADSSCLLHLQGRARRLSMRQRFAHIAEIMSESLR